MDQRAYGLALAQAEKYRHTDPRAAHLLAEHERLAAMPRPLRLAEGLRKLIGMVGGVCEQAERASMLLEDWRGEGWQVSELDKAASMASLLWFATDVERLQGEAVGIRAHVSHGSDAVALERRIGDSLRRVAELTPTIPELVEGAAANPSSAVTSIGTATKGLREALTYLGTACEMLALAKASMTDRTTPASDTGVGKPPEPIGNVGHGDAKAPAASPGAEATLEYEPPDDAFLSEADIAKAGGVNQDTLRKRLPEWRRTHNNNDWHKVENPRPRDPRYQYRWGSIKPLVQSIRRTASVPSKKEKQCKAR